MLYWFVTEEELVLVRLLSWFSVPKRRVCRTVSARLEKRFGARFVHVHIYDDDVSGNHSSFILFVLLSFFFFF